jgi:hypothetical protein
MHVTELEDLLSSPITAESERDDLKSFVALLSCISDLGADYALIGTIALGIHARPRFTRRIHVVRASRLPNIWIESLHPSYSEGFLSQKNQKIQSVGQLSIRVSGGEAEKSAILNAKTIPVFGLNVRVAEPVDLLWLYLETEDCMESLSEAVELISRLPGVAEELHTRLETKRSALVYKLEDWVGRAQNSRLSSYSKRVSPRINAKTKARKS